jgi:hypothetical protein
MNDTGQSNKVSTELLVWGNYIHDLLHIYVPDRQRSPTISSLSCPFTGSCIHDCQCLSCYVHCIKMEIIERNIHITCVHLINIESVTM